MASTWNTFEFLKTKPGSPVLANSPHANSTFDTDIHLWIHNCVTAADSAVVLLELDV